MTVIRAFVRRCLATEPACFALLEGHELSWLALYADRGFERYTHSASRFRNDYRYGQDVIEGNQVS